jgi:hypothetical protein
MEFDTLLKKGTHKGYEWTLKIDEDDCVELEYRGVAHSGRLMYDIVKIGGSAKYIDKYFKESDFKQANNDLHRTDLRFMCSGNGFDKHCDLGM